MPTHLRQDCFPKAFCTQIALKPTGKLARLGGQNQGSFAIQEPFVQHGWCHTVVTHKKKVGQKIQFVAERVVQMRDGQTKKSCPELKRLTDIGDLCGVQLAKRL